MSQSQISIPVQPTSLPTLLRHTYTRRAQTASQTHRGRADNFSFVKIDQISKGEINLFKNEGAVRTSWREASEGIYSVSLLSYTILGEAVFIYLLFLSLILFQSWILRKTEGKRRSFNWVNVRPDVIEHLTRRNGGRKGNAKNYLFFSSKCKNKQTQEINPNKTLCGKCYCSVMVLLCS